MPRKTERRKWKEDKDTFVGTMYRIGPTKVIYEQPKFNRVLEEMGRALVANGYSIRGGDLTKLHQYVVGFSTPGNRTIILSGPRFIARNQYPIDFDWEAHFMSQDRRVIDDLVNVVFSRPDLVAKNSTSIGLTPLLWQWEFGPNAYRRAVIIYAPSAAPAGSDHMRVQIEGKGNGPNTFSFRHTTMWMSNRYPTRSPAVPVSVTSLDNAASSSASAPSSDDVD